MVMTGFSRKPPHLKEESKLAGPETQTKTTGNIDCFVIIVGSYWSCEALLAYGYFVVCAYSGAGGQNRTIGFRRFRTCGPLVRHTKGTWLGIIYAICELGFCGR
jgi:hypothetical protein